MYTFPILMRIFIPIILCITAIAATLVQPKKDARRLEVLFFGAPTAAHPGHDPITRYRVIKRNLGTEGINFTYSEEPAVVFNAKTLEHFDAVMMYGNWLQNGPMPADQLKALTDYVESGHGFLPLHCASACYGGSPEFIKLVGGRFKSHTDGVFEPKNTSAKHPIIDGFKSFSAWDETYVHDNHGDDRVILQTREQEPWTWVRNQGNGRVFYTASGHDHRVWDLPQFHELLKRAVYWSVGPEAYGKLKALDLPKLEMEKVELPGYLKRQLITEAQKPLSPEDSMKLAQVPPGFELSLFASEPDIVNPIALSWDAKGRCFVIQTTDYPNDLHEGKMGNDKIIICDDTDKDGRADKFTTFADKLSIPASLVCVNGGVIAANCSEILWLKDSNGDDKADVRETLISGFGTGDTHAGVSNLRLGPDGWIYGTVGYSGYNGQVGGENVRFSSGVFRFLPDGSKLEFLQSTTNNTWGLGFTEDYDVIGSTANGNPSWQLSLAKSLYDKAGVTQPKTPRCDDNPIFNPSSADIRQVDQFERYTAGAGHAVYTARRFPEKYHNAIAFVTEGTGKLVGQFQLTTEGSSFVATQLPNNLYNSADAWSGPVFAETGPDGAVWICDWYNLIIQHNPTPNKASAGIDAKNGKGNAYETPVRDKRHGRIYRVYPKGSKNDLYPGSMADAAKHANQFWQLQSIWAQKNFTRSPIGVSTELVASSSNPERQKLADLVNIANKPVAADTGKKLYDFLTVNKQLHKDPVMLDAWRIAARIHADAVLAAAPAANTEAKEPEPVNVMNNGDMEQHAGTLPRGWKPNVYNGGQSAFTIDPKGGRNDSSALKVVSEQPSDSGAMLEIPAKRGARYKLGGWIKTDKVELRGGRGSMFNVHGRDGTTQAVHGTKDWTEVSTTFTAEDDQVTINCLTGSYGQATGTTWFDDVYLIQLDGAGTGDEIADLRKWKASSNAAPEVAKVRKHKPDTVVHKRGEDIYAKTCIACHQPGGVGQEGIFPPLDGSDWLSVDGSLEAKIVLKGLQGKVTVNGKDYTNVMPPHIDLNDQQIADVLTFVRQTGKNDFPAVAPDLVKKIRQETKAHLQPWTAQELGK